MVWDNKVTVISFFPLLFWKNSFCSWTYFENGVTLILIKRVMHCLLLQLIQMLRITLVFFLSIPSLLEFPLGF